ncbi:MAG TPA: DMT family transporter [Phycisphaerales bacterium]|nr:DMT family transporter [Phycisphaerales bacterium]
MPTKAQRADAMLLLVAIIWGTGFVAQRQAMEHIGPLLFTAIRFTIGAIVLIPFLSGKKSTGKEWRPGIILGLVMFAAASLQQIGLVTTTASRAGFITGLYVLLVPIVGLVFGHRFHRGHVAGAILAAIGLYLLSGDLSGETRTGDVFVMGCAILWAVHVSLVGHLAPKAEPIRLALTQFVTVAILASIATPFFETISIGAVWDAKLAILYSGILAIGIAFSLQVIAQRDAPPTHAAILMSLEALFAAITGWLMLNEQLTPKELTGCALMLAGMIASQLWTRKKTREERAIATDPVR